MNGMQLMRLRDCARATLLGQVMQWPGSEMRGLEAMGFLTAVPLGDSRYGHQATAQGLAYLKQPDVLKQLEVL